MTTEILIVGAGAVGQVFALHLQRGGARISFFVRPGHPLPSTLQLAPGVTGTATLEHFARLTTVDEIAHRSFDQVWLAVPVDALGGGWIPGILAASREATVVAFAPESEGHLPSQRRVLGAIPFLAWQHPLPGERDARSPPPSKIAYWLPPLARVPLSGPRERVAAVYSLLKAGGLKPQRVRDAAKTAAPVTALMMGTVAGMEAAGWTLAGFRGAWARVAAGGAKEALRLSNVSSLWTWVARGWLLTAVLRIAARIAPFDLEAYLRFHFTKVGIQTRVLLRAWLAQARTRGLPVPHLERLLRAIDRTA